MTPNSNNKLCACKREDCTTPFGMCHCGCGKVTPVYPRTYSKRGILKGDHALRLQGHGNRQKREFTEQPVGVNYRMVPLTKGMFAHVSPHRFDEINACTWRALWRKKGKCFYAVRSVRIDGKSKMIFMHRQILGLGFGEPETGDHKDRKKTLDNTDENLRLANQLEQMWNTGKHIDNTSGYKGVFFDKRRGKYFAKICVNYKQIYLGSFVSKELAYIAYCAAAVKYFGEFACST